MKSKCTRIVVFLATGLGAGWSPIMPGTVGAAWGLPLSWLLFLGIESWVLRAVALVLLAAAGVPLCQQAAQAIGRKDPGSVVWDEIVSLPWVFWWLPPAAVTRWEVLLLGFLLHRLFDIGKPPPLRRLENLPGGWGIMADDLGAAAYAGGVLYLIVRFWL